MTFDERRFRDALGRFGTGVCIVTADLPGHVPLGITVNSFASVSLDPPLVLWSLQKHGDCSAAMAAVKNYAINVLAVDQQSLSTLYAQRGKHELSSQHYRIGKTGCPIIRDALVSFECELWQCYDGGDHDIWVSKVLAIDGSRDDAPLLFYGSNYRQLR